MLGLTLYLYMTNALDHLASSLRNRDQKGQVAAEYLGVLVVVGGIIAAVFSTGLGDKIAGHLGTTVQNIFTHAKP
jgi:hypothetical protein